LLTHTRHGHPDLCSINLYVTIESEDIRHNVNIPYQSFLLVRNDQYAESEQVIVEIRQGTCIVNFKEKVRKYIYSDSNGKMHWSIDISSLVSLLFHKVQDQMSVHPRSVERRSTSNLSVTKEQMISETGLYQNFDLFRKRRKNRFIIPLQLVQEHENDDLMPSSGISIEIPITSIS
ncbi:hypothetical protein MIMGU_mgv1a023172mg, partial [Erythranthe guttata]